MAINVVTQFAGDPRKDVVSRQRHAALVREVKRGTAKETYKTVEVEIEDGPPDEKTHKRAMTRVRLRYAIDSEYVFAVYGENPNFINRSMEEWRALAAEALHKFAAINHLMVKMGPRNEDGARFNLMAELAGKIEVSDRVKKLEAKAKKEHEARLAAVQAALDEEEEDEE